MNSTILMYVCVPCAAVLAVIWFFAALNEKGVNPFDAAARFYRKQPVLGQFLLPVLIVQLLVYGSTKTPTNDVSGAGSSSTNEPPLLTMSWPRPQTPDPRFESGFTSDELALGYALWRTGTNETWTFDPVPGARTCGRWLLRGAAEDWEICATTNLGPVAMTTDGRLITTNGVFTAYDGRLALVPEANGRLSGANAPSRVWWAETPWESTVFTWQNALLGRDTNTPVSVQAEFTRDGDFIYRYDLAAAGTNLTSEIYYRLRPEDLEEGDRDGDGLSTHDEVTLYHTDPGLVDSDGDGLTDGDEVSNGTDPTERSVPNEEIIARVTGSATNELFLQGWKPDPDVALTAVKLWDGFAAEWSDNLTNLVYERVVSFGEMTGWQSHFLSSEPDAAGDWDLRGLVLEWDDGCGNSGTVRASAVGDSFPLPITNATVTIRLRAVGTKIRSLKPMYLVGYAPSVELSGGTAVRDAAGVVRAYCLNGAADELTLDVTIDRSRRPCKAPLAPGELAIPGLADIESGSDGFANYEGDGNGGTITVSGPGSYELPAFAGEGDGMWILCLDPSVRFGDGHRFAPSALEYDSASGGYRVERAYPLDSKCLWRDWCRATNGSLSCSCEPEANAGGGIDALPFVETLCEVDAGLTVATGVVKVFGQEVWRGTAAHSWRDLVESGSVCFGSEFLSRAYDCEDCEGGCEDGDCDQTSGSGLGSVKFRLSLGMPRAGRHSGFVHFESEGPVAVTTDLFEVTSRDDAAVTDVTSGAGRIVACADRNGRQVVMAPMEDGVRLTVTVLATQELEDVWEVFNEDGDTNVVRIVQLSRLDNVMSDLTYACDEDGVWTKTDNVSGVSETLDRVDRLNDPSDGGLYETRTTRGPDGEFLDRVYTRSSRIGSFGNAVLRETYWEQYTGNQYRWRAADYWNDAAHADRHGQLRLLTGNCIAWEYHDYDVRGFETLRVEQRNGSSVPTEFPMVVAGDLFWTGGLADAFVTVYDYTPLTGDDGDRDDADKVRCETRYVVRNGLATCIARTWTRYTHVVRDGFAAVKAETRRAGSASAGWDDPSNARSHTVTYSETDGSVPFVLRGELAEELDEDGVLTVRRAVDGSDRVIETAHRSMEEVPFPTYEVVERDRDFGDVVRRATYLADGRGPIDEELSAYDEKRRLRSTRYSDGTSETNAWSCCRKLWSRDREGRKTLRSAVTGQDRLYYAEEEVSLRELSTNGEHKVTQRFFDGLGRETATVVYSAAVAGEATDSSASQGKALAVTTTEYPFGGDDRSVAVDARGKLTMSESVDFADRTERTDETSSGTGSVEPDMRVRTTEWRNGARVTEKEWDGKWTRTTEWEDYDVTGRSVRFEVTESSDCGTVTNRIAFCDFLGRTVREETPDGAVETTYHGATGRADVTTVTAGEVVRVSTALYNARGEDVGSVRDGVTDRTDESYEEDAEENVWKVTRRVRSDGVTVESSFERREQLTGRASGVFRRQIDIDGDGVAQETVECVGTAEGERVTVVSNAVSGVMSATRRYGLVTETVTPDERVTNCYDAFGRCVGRVRIPSATQGVIPCETYAYDGVGNLVAKSVYTNETDFVTEAYGYDGYGRRVSVVDALGNETVTDYDAVGNVVAQSGAMWPVRFGYDTAGRRISLSTTKDGRIWDVTGWTYDSATGRCTAKRYPDGSQVSYALTPDGLPSRTTKASGDWSGNAYDAARRLIGTVSSDGTGDAAFAYDVFGRMTAASNAVARFVYARHRGGIVTNETVRTGGSVRTLVRAVDGFGRLSARGVSGQEGQSISYDGRGRLAAISNDTAVVTYAYGADGSDVGHTLALNGGVTIERRVIRDGYRPGLIVAVSNFVNGVAVCGESYVRDALGRVIGRERGSSGAATYVYDAIGQIVGETIGQSEQSNGYAYDQIGNIAGSAALVTTVDGEVSELGDLALGYDSSSRLTTVATGDVTIATYAYDMFDRRVRKTTAEAVTTYLYDGWNLVREEIAGTNGTTDVIEYFWGKDVSGALDTAGGIGGLLYLKRNGAVYVPLCDANGNVTSYVDAAGDVVVSFVYDAFGNSAVRLHLTSSPFIPAFRYSTKYTDAETGFVYYGYRHYAPSAVRWLTRDPLEERGGLNLHCFCENDGVNNVDWLGRVAEPTQDGEGRRYWRRIADMLRKDGYTLTAKMLDLSLENHGSEKFSESSKLSQSIKESGEYDALYNLLLLSCREGWNLNIDKTYDLVYKGGDLHHAVTPTSSEESAKLKFTGKLRKTCNQKKGRDKVKLNIEVTSDFSYADWRFDTEHGKMKDRVGDGSKYMDTVHSFEWESKFKDHRR